MCGMAWAFLVSPRILMAHYEYNNKTSELYDVKGKLIAACIDTNMILTYKGNHQIIERVRCE